MPKKKPKPLNKLGKISKLRIARRAQWIAEHPPNHEGYYICYLCHRWVPADEMQLDHVLPKSGTTLAVSMDDNNLKPACSPCNMAKGSKRL